MNRVMVVVELALALALAFVTDLVYFGFCRQCQPEQAFGLEGGNSPLPAVFGRQSHRPPEP